MLSFAFREQPLAAFLRPTPFERLRVLCSSPELEELESKLESRYKMMKLRDSLEQLPSGTAVYIDTPPALSFYSRSAMIAAQSLLIPFDCDDFSRQALYTLLNNVRESHTRACPMIHLDPNHKLSRELEALYDLLEREDTVGVRLASAPPTSTMASAMGTRIFPPNG